MLDFVVLGDDLARGAAKAGDRAAAAQECLRMLQIVPSSAQRAHGADGPPRALLTRAVPPV